MSKKRKVSDLELHDDQLAHHVVAVVPLSEIGKFKTEVFEELKNRGHEEVSEKDLEDAIIVVADRWKKKKTEAKA